MTHLEYECSYRRTACTEEEEGEEEEEEEEGEEEEEEEEETGHSTSVECLFRMTPLPAASTRRAPPCGS